MFDLAWQVMDLTHLEKIIRIESQGNVSTDISPNDSLGQVMGKEHPGRVRGLGGGICPTQAFGTNYQQYRGRSIQYKASNTELQQKVATLELKLQSKGEKIKRMEMLIAKLYMNANMPLPKEVANNNDDSVSYCNSLNF